MNFPAVSNAKDCPQCGLTFIPARSSAVYCSPACRQAHHRHDQPKGWRVCEGIDCDNDLGPWMRRDARYCSPACRQRHYDAYDRPISSLVLADLSVLFTPREAHS